MWCKGEVIAACALPQTACYLPMSALFDTGNMEAKISEISFIQDRNPVTARQVKSINTTRYIDANNIIFTRSGDMLRVVVTEPQKTN